MTPQGYTIVHTNCTRPIQNRDRYINPKMEQELVLFKKKIAYRFENSQIPKDYLFPRAKTESKVIDNNMSHNRPSKIDNILN